MRVELILPITTLHGKLNRQAGYYFRTLNGRTFVQRCPARTAKPSANQVAARRRFATIAQLVAQMRRNGSKKDSKQLWKIATEAYDAAKN